MSTSPSYPPLSPGKFRAISRMIDQNGCFKMVAADQREPMRGILRQALGHMPTFEDMMAMKRMLAQELGEKASALLIDPEYGLPAVLKVLPGGLGLIVALEDSNFETTPGGRKSRVIPNWSVEKIKRLGGEGVKYLVWYSPKADPAVIQHQLDLIRRLGQECKRYDVAFLLEILVYQHKEDTASFARDRTDHVLRSIEAFADPSFGVDVYKLECPVEATGLAGDAAARERLMALFQQMAGSLKAPWVMLSAAADPSDFVEVLRCAYAAGSSGFLAGRSIWQTAAKAYPDEPEVRRLLRTVAVPYLQELNRLTDKLAHPYKFEVALPALSSVEHFPKAFSGF